MFEAVAKNPLVIKYKDGLVSLHFDIEDQLKKKGYVENNDHEIDEAKIQEYVVNDEETPQDRVNVRVQNRQRNCDRGIPL